MSWVKILLMGLLSNDKTNEGKNVNKLQNLDKGHRVIPCTILATLL